MQVHPETLLKTNRRLRISPTPMILTKYLWVQGDRDQPFHLSLEFEPALAAAAPRREAAKRPAVEGGSRSGKTFEA